MITPLLLLFASLGARAEDGLQIRAGWRPTLRRAYVFYGASQDQIPLGALIAGDDPASGEGLSNDVAELGRFEASAQYRFHGDLAVHAQIMGGPFELRFYDQGQLHRGTDWSFDLGGSIRHALGEDLGFETVMAGRVRPWILGDDLPLHGNVGIVLGVKPSWRGLSLYVEGTLAAVWLTDLTEWGAQKDSSVLRIRPGYTWTHDALELSAALDYYHTHTEFFGTELIPGEEAFMLDDFDLALVIGAGWRL